MTASLLNKLKFYYKSLTKPKMKISTQIVGTKSKAYQFQVTDRQISNYAASIFDENQIYYKTAQGKDMVAHPLFPVRISWKIIENINQQWETDLPGNILDNLVHQSEYLEIHRLLKPGDKLRIVGEIIALLPHKRGTRITIKFDYYDQNNQKVLSEFLGAIIFGSKCSDSGKTTQTLPVTTKIERDTPLWEEKIAVSRVAPFLYDGCNEIVYPIHTDQGYARSVGLPDIILQGTATLAMSVSALIRKELKNNPRRINVVSGKFTGIVVPPNQLSVWLLKKSEQKIYFDVSDQDDNFVLRGGYINFT
jgi:hydroxyacyl-ACP dehydratase HTD2-like protein with hotdog domain